MDIQKILLEVYEKTGIRIDEVDPVLTVVALNEIMFENLMSVYQTTMEKNVGELDERIGSLVVLHRNMVAAGKDLVERADQAHLNAALKAAAEAKAEIFKVAQEAVSQEISKATGMLTAATKRAENGAGRGWGIAIVQAVIGGIVAGLIVLAALQLR